jgi:mannose-6-phosphate isomerase
VELLDNPIRGYAWGSRTVIAQIQGRPAPCAGPEAEMWLGAHPDSPSALARNGRPVPLTELIRSDPLGLLGEPVLRRFGPRLPFLVKLLAADEPLSLQVHPDAEQARAGFAAEEAGGVPPGAARRYVDRYHKPELLVALGEFEALCGFRAPGDSAELLGRLDVPELAATLDELSRPDPGEALCRSVRGLLAMPATERARLVAAVARAARSGRPDSGDAAERRLRRLAAELSDRYPADAGVVVALLLNHVCLRPGQAIWMPPGNLHSYLRGAGVEAMSASDNVLRGGLTRKHVDAAEFLRLLRFEVLVEPVVASVPAGPGLQTWPVPVEEFRLHRAVVRPDAADVELPGHGPRIVLCVRGQVRVDDGVAAVRLRGGQAAFGAAGEAPVRAGGTGEIFQATTP